MNRYITCFVPINKKLNDSLDEDADEDDYGHGYEETVLVKEEVEWSIIGYHGQATCTLFVFALVSVVALAVDLVKAQMIFAVFPLYVGISKGIPVGAMISLFVYFGVVVTDSPFFHLVLASYTTLVFVII